MRKRIALAAAPTRRVRRVRSCRDVQHECKTFFEAFCFGPFVVGCQIWKQSETTDCPKKRKDKFQEFYQKFILPKIHRCDDSASCMTVALKIDYRRYVILICFVAVVAAAAAIDRLGWLEIELARYCK